ncbi:MAG: CorA family divalent cation transporter, partial [Acidimicrobiales bacterium]
MPTDVRTYGDGTLTWVDVVDPTEEELEQVARLYTLHALALEDVAKHGQRPKLEQYPNHAFVVAYSADLQEVDLFVGEGWLLCVRERDESGAVWDDKVAQTRFERLSGNETTVGFLLYVLLDELVDGYFTCADEAEAMLEHVEELIFGPPDPDQPSAQEQLFAIRRRLVAYRRLVVPLRDVVSALLRGEVAAVDERARVHLQDVHDHV